MRNALRNHGILLVVFASIVWGACGGGGGVDCISEVSNTNFEESESFSLPGVDAGIRTLFGLIGENGSITVTGSLTATSVTIEGTKRVRSESPGDAAAHLADLDVDVDLGESPSAVFVETIRPQCTGGRIYAVDYTITLPPYFQVLVTNTNGNVTIDGIDDDVSVVLLNGEIFLGKVDGINGGASAALLNGTIDAEVILPAGGEIKFDVVNGTINLGIPVNTSAQFIASSTNGSVNLSSSLVLDPVLQSPNPLEGTLGTGQGTIDLEIDNGDINVTGL